MTDNAPWFDIGGAAAPAPLDFAAGRIAREHLRAPARVPLPDAIDAAILRAVAGRIRNAGFNPGDVVIERIVADYNATLQEIAR